MKKRSDISRNRTAEVDRTSAYIEFGYRGPLGPFGRRLRQGIAAGAILFGSLPILLGYNQNVSKPEQTNLDKYNNGQPLAPAGPPEIPDEVALAQPTDRRATPDELLERKLRAQQVIDTKINHESVLKDRTVFWGRVEVRQDGVLVGDIFNPDITLKGTTGLGTGSHDWTPYGLMGVVPGAPSPSAQRPWTAVRSEAFFSDEISGSGTTFAFYDHHNNPIPMDRNESNIDENAAFESLLITGVDLTRRDDIAGDVFSLQFADGTAAAWMQTIVKSNPPEAFG